MLKILINNEEVVCDKQLEIKEEMLATSSCILNNCYPKSWENTKDYTTQYYYPKDYSKCLIYDKKLLLPKEYTQVDYIESHHAEYINTGYYCNPNTRIECDFQFTQVTQKQQRVFGNIYGEIDGLSVNMYINGSGKFAWACQNGNGNWKGTTLNADTNKHKFIMDMKNDKIYIDDYTENITTTHTNTAQNSLYLLAYRGNSGAVVAKETLAYGKMYSARIYENDVLVRDFIPCYRNSDNVVGLYDLVNDVFYTNQGTGAFTYGQIQEQIVDELLFSGVIKNTGNISLNPRQPHYCNLEVLDFKTFLSECDQLDFVINNKTITEAIEQVTEAVSSYGFVVGNININDNTIIGAYSTQEKTPYDVFQYLADISQSRWFTRLIDENTVAIDFYNPEEMERGIDLDFSNNEFACRNNVENLTFNYGTYDYRNKQIMLSDQVFGGVDFEETIIADGYAKTFNTMSNIGILLSIYVDGVEKSYATQDEKQIGLEADFYYTPGSNTLESNENDGTYTAGSEIKITYTPLIKGRQVVTNTDEINRINLQTGRNGVIARYESRNDVLSNNELNLVGQSYIKYKGTPEINLTLVTKDYDLYNIGQIVYFNYPNIEDLSKDYMVKSKKTKIINTATDWNIWYTYTLTSNFNSETAINYFDNQRAKASGNIQSGDYITRNIDIEQTALIVFSNATATELTITDNNILNAPLNAPFTQ